MLHRLHTELSTSLSCRYDGIKAALAEALHRLCTATFAKGQIKAVSQKLRMILTCEMKRNLQLERLGFLFKWLDCCCNVKGNLEFADGCYSWTNSSNGPLFYQHENGALKSFVTTKEKQCNGLNELLIQGSTLYHASALQELASWNCWPDKQFAHTACQAACLSGLADSHGRKSTTGLGGVVVVVGNSQVITSQSVYNCILVWMGTCDWLVLCQPRPHAVYSISVHHMLTGW